MTMLLGDFIPMLRTI